MSNASNKTAIQLAIDAKDPVLVDIMHQSLNAMKTKRILSLEKQLVEMQNEYKRLFKSIATSATRKKKNKTKRARNSERKGKSGGNSSGGREGVTYSSQSDLSEGFWSNSEGGGGDVSASSADPVGADAGTNAPSPTTLLPSKPSARTSPTSLETTSFSSLRDWSPASPTRSQRSHAKYPIVRKQYALRDIQTFLFMLHNKRFELLNDAISLWKGFLFHDRQARPVFLHPGSLARRQRELELVSPSQSSSSGTGGGIRKWLQRGYKGGVNNSRSNIGDGRNFDEHVGAHTGNAPR